MTKSTEALTVEELNALERLKDSLSIVDLYDDDRYPASLLHKLIAAARAHLEGTELSGTPLIGVTDGSQDENPAPSGPAPPAPGEGELLECGCWPKCHAPSPDNAEEIMRKVADDFMQNGPYKVHSPDTAKLVERLLWHSNGDSSIHDVCKEVADALEALRDSIWVMGERCAALRKDLKKSAAACVEAATTRDNNWARIQELEQEAMRLSEFVQEVADFSNDPHLANRADEIKGLWRAKAGG